MECSLAADVESSLKTSLWDLEISDECFFQDLKAIMQLGNAIGEFAPNSADAGRRGRPGGRGVEVIGSFRVKELSIARKG